MSDTTINVTVSRGATISSDSAGAVTVNTQVDAGGEIAATVTGGGTGPKGDTGATGATGATGSQGPQGDPGTDGTDGVGVPTAGTTAQVLRKASNTNFDTEWHTPVKADVGLGNADNTSDANKPVSTATQTALDGKQTLDADLTTIAALDSSTAGALVTDGAGWIRKTYAQLKTALGLVKGDVGLGNVDNTSDVNKPVSTATQTALDAKVTGPASATDTAVALYDGTTGELIKDSVVLVDSNGNVVLATSDSGALGSATKMWGDLFLASGSIINWNNGDITLTHSANALTLTGGTLVTNDISPTNGSAVRTRTTAGNTLLLSAYDVDGAAYTTFVTLTANNTPTMDLADAVTKAGQYIYRAGGTDVPITDGGTGASTDSDARTNLGLGALAVLNAVTEAEITLADNTTNDFSTTKHGFVPKGVNLGKFLKDDGTWASIPGGGDMLASTYDPATVSEQLVGLTATQTLTNKTLTSPKINENVAVTATATELNYTDGVTSAIQTQIDGKQPLDSDLTTIAGLTATTDNFMVATASAWASRTPTQARSQMGLGTLATNSSVTNALLSTSAGEIGAAWAAWTPTWGNLTVSGSTVTALYKQIGKTVHFRVHVALGGGNVPSGSVTFSLPVTSVTYAGTAGPTIGQARYEDTGTTNSHGIVTWATTTTAALRVFNASGTYVVQNSLSSTVPHTWANTDEIYAQGFYEVA